MSIVVNLGKEISTDAHLPLLEQVVAENCQYTRDGVVACYDNEDGFWLAEIRQHDIAPSSLRMNSKGGLVSYIPMESQRIRADLAMEYPSLELALRKTLFKENPLQREFFTSSLLGRMETLLQIGTTGPVLMSAVMGTDSEVRYSVSTLQEGCCGNPMDLATKRRSSLAEAVVAAQKWTQNSYLRIHPGMAA